jgi:hypothetical protein
VQLELSVELRFGFYWVRVYFFHFFDSRAAVLTPCIWFGLVWGGILGGIARVGVGVGFSLFPPREHFIPGPPTDTVEF